MTSHTRDRWNQVVRRLLTMSVFVGSVAAAYVGVGALRDESPPASGAETESDGGENPFASSHGTHLIAFVITASDCGWSNLPATMETIGSIRERMRSKYEATYAAVSVVGVALDEDLEAGLDFLDVLGGRRSFDQVSVGGSWLNEQVVRFAWREQLIQAATPQIILVERFVDTHQYVASGTIGVQADRLLANPRGTAEILQWVRNGLPLDYVPYRGPSADSASK